MSDLSIFRSGGSLDYAKMGVIAELPSPLSYDDFTKMLKNSPNARLTSSNNNVYYTTPAGEVKIYLPRAYGHFSKNGKYGNGKQERQELTGTLMQILDNPLFVTKDTQDKLYFYKPFKRKARNANSESEILDLISVSIDKYGRFEYRTTYKDTRNQVLDMINGYKVVYKAKLE